MSGKQTIMVILSGIIAFSSVLLSPSVIWASDTQESSSSSEDFWSEAEKKAKETGQDIKKTAKSAGQKGKEIGSKVAEKASDASNKAKEGMMSITSQFKAFVSKIDTKEFERGWDMVANYASSGLGNSLGRDYLQNVEKSITKLQNDINSAGQGSARTNAVEGGFLAEQWHADTYNVNSTAAGSKSYAETLGKNTKGSVDVQTSWDENYSLKYYKSGSDSARAQSKSILESYRKDNQKTLKDGGTPESLKEYINNIDSPTEFSDLYDAYYKDQKRLIPSDQMKEAETYLKRRVAKESVSESERKNLSKSTQETLDNLTDRINNKEEGITSEPLTENEAKAIAELSKNGDFKPSDFGVTTSQVVKPRYILKQAMRSGASAAIMQAALSAGPDIYKIFVEAAKTGKVNEKNLKELGVDALLNGSEGFAEGSISNAILVAAKAGKLGKNMTNISPDTVGTLTVLTIDAARYGYKLSKGQITAVEYGDYMAEDIVVAVVSQSSGAALQALLPMCPFAYLAGSMAGAMLASTGYTFGKQAMLDFKDAGGFAAIVPEESDEGKSIGKEIFSTEKVKAQVSEIADMAVSTTKKGYIKITQSE